MDNKMIPLVFVRYNGNTTVYRLFDLETRKMICLRLQLLLLWRSEINVPCDHWLPIQHKQEQSISQGADRGKEKK